MSRADLAGMTGNERLFELGLLAKFDAATAARDREALLEIMRLCEVPTPERTVDSILDAPEA
jgi:carbamoylphosphate synthase large subunit